MPTVSDYTALLSGSTLNGATGKGAFVSFSFPTSVPEYLNSSYPASGLATFREFNDSEKQNARAVIQAYSAVSGITFFEVASGEGQIKFMNFNLASLNSNAAGFAYYPDGGYGGDVNSDIFISDGYAGSAHILLHELGHALGLKHSFEGNITLASNRDNFFYTVMSYTSGGYSGDVLGSLDIDAIHYLYGDAGAKGTQIANWTWDGSKLTQIGTSAGETLYGIGGGDVINGLDGDDTIVGRDGRNVLDGGGGNDTLSGGYDDNTIYGRDGDDRITINLSSTSRFTIDGGAGTDSLTINANTYRGNTISIPAMLAAGSSLAGVESVTISAFGSTARTIVGSSVNDTLYGGSADDTISGGGGNDYLSGQGGSDVLSGEAGSDSFYSDGLDRIYGGDDDDNVTVTLGDAPHFVVDGGAGNDRLTLNASDTSGDTISIPALAAAGSSIVGIEQISIYAFNGRAMTLVGSSGKDTISGSGGNDTISGGDGDDSLSGGDGNDTLSGGEGADSLSGGRGNDMLSGGAGVDSLAGGDGSDTLSGEGGNDFLYGDELDSFSGGEGDDYITITAAAGLAGYPIDGGAGNDTLSVTFTDNRGRAIATSALNASGIENLTISAGSGNDVLTSDVAGIAVNLYGQGGDDVLRAGGSGRSLYGGDGNDQLFAGTAFNFLYGGTGADRFVFDSVASSTGGAQDQIEDFETGVDLIDLSGFSPTDFRIQNYSFGNYIYGTGTGGQFQLFVRQAVSASDVLYTVLSGTPGTDALTGTSTPELLTGGGGNDMLKGGGGRDTLTGGAGADTFSGTRAELAGDTITDFDFGDRIEVTDAASYGFGYTRVGTTLTVGVGQSVTLANNPVGRLVTGGTFDGPAQITLANRMTGLADFDGNGHSDILWREGGGSFSTWQVSGNAQGNQFAVNSVFDTSVDTTWKIQDTFDFDGDGRSDIVWRNSGSGQFTVWTGAAGRFTANSYDDKTVSTDWQIAGLGDLNGDGKDDIVWRQDGGAFSTWQSTGSGFARNVAFDTSVTPEWKIVGLGDFDGDGKDDLLWRNQTSGAFSTWTSNGSGFTPNTTFISSVDETWHIDGLADFNGDGRDDILWRHDGDGTFTEWQSTGAGFAPNVYSNASVVPIWQIQTTGDFNDDGRADILWRNTATGDFSTWQSNGNGFDPNTAYVSGVGTNWQVQGHSFQFG